ncbi:MAG: hypothetical protein Q8K92_06320 [Leadbetterella sp.]|nr:hypothetical protein [Leadbetterella sp.]
MKIRWENKLFNVHLNGSIEHKEKKYFLVVDEVLSDEDYIEKAKTMPAEEFGYYSQARIISQHLIQDLINIKTSFLESKKKFVVPIIFFSLDYKKPTDENIPCIVSTSNWIPRISIDSDIYKWDNSIGKFRDSFGSAVDRIFGEKIKYWAYLVSHKHDVEYHLFVESAANDDNEISDSENIKNDPKILVNELLNTLIKTFDKIETEDSNFHEKLNEKFSELKEQIWKTEGVIGLLEEWNNNRKHALKWHNLSDIKPKENIQVIVTCKQTPLEYSEYTTVAIYDKEKSIFINPSNNLEYLNPQPDYWSYFKKP